VKQIALFVAAAVAAATVAPSAFAQGSVNGTVIWSDKTVPTNEAVKVDKDIDVCTKDGKVYKNELIVDAKTKGVKNVVFWLVDAKSPLKPIPTPAGLKGKVVKLDQPRCEFTPRFTPVLDGQKLEVLNSAPVAHNIKIDGGSEGPELNVTVPAGGKLPAHLDVKPRTNPVIPMSCTIHPWMRSWLLAMPSPYYAITNDDGSFQIKDVPAGEYRIVGWHEKIGWIFPGKDMATRNKLIVVKDKAASEVGKLPRKVEDDD